MEALAQAYVDAYRLFKQLEFSGARIETRAARAAWHAAERALFEAVDAL